MDLSETSEEATLLTATGLAAREDLDLGGVIVSPSTRTLRGPGGRTDVAPRVMQVLIVLADAVGQVVTRETLFNRCWGGVYVGDDSLNRAIAELRRAITSVGGRFHVETIPRTGYVLVQTLAGNQDRGTLALTGHSVTRRKWLMGAGAAAAIGGAALWSGMRSRSTARFGTLLRQAEASLREETADKLTASRLEEAVALRPDSAKAWGLLALVRSLIGRDPASGTEQVIVRKAEYAARQALTIDSSEPNALLAMFELQGSTLDWTMRDNRLRQILDIDPHHLNAINELVLLLQAAGLNKESWAWNERALAIEPLSSNILGRRALKLWIAGHTADADKVIDQARALDPSEPWTWHARFMILALSGRPQAAKSMLDNDGSMIGPPQAAEMWRESLMALERQSLESRTRARDVCLKSARMGGQLGGEAVMILSQLGEVDAAFAVAYGMLLSRGSVVGPGKATFPSGLSDASWRISTQWLFVPPVSSMRADPRFLPLCEGVGLVNYWRSRGVRPDYQTA